MKKKLLKLNYLPLSFVIIILAVGSFFYFYNVVEQNKIAAESIEVEQTINEISSCHIYYLRAIKEKRGYQITKEKIFFYNYTEAKKEVNLHLKLLQNNFYQQKENILFNKYEAGITKRLTEMDRQLAILNNVNTGQTTLKNNKEYPAFIEPGNEEETLYNSIVKSLKNTRLHLATEKENIEKYNYAGFIALVSLTVLLVLLNIKQVKKLTYQKLRREKEMEMLGIIKASEQEFSAAFEYASIGIGLVGLKGEWLRVNKSLCAMFGYSSSELMMCTFQDITHEDDLKLDL